MLGKLEIIHGNNVGTCLLIRNGETWSIGRSSEANFCVDDDRMSRVHCEIASKEDVFEIHNRGSRNGCHINGKKEENSPVHAGDIIRIGRTVFEFSIAKDENELKNPVAPAPAVPSQKMFSEETLLEIRKKASEEAERSHHQTLEAAQIQQQKMLPKTPNIPGFEIDTLYLPAEFVSGDFYDFISLKNNKLGILIGDVSGHGVEAALVMGMARKVIHLHAKNHEDPHYPIVAANEDILPDLDEKMFCSVFYGTLDIDNKIFRFVRAGHNPLLLINPRRQPPLQEFNPKGIVLGMIGGERFGKTLEEITLELRSGDILLQYTDGVFEAVNEKNEEWGKTNFHEIVKKYGNTTPKYLLQKIQQGVKAFSGNAKQSDDITLLALKVL